MRLAPEVDRATVSAALADRGIATRPYLPAIHLQPTYRERFAYGPGMLPVTERVFSSTLALPFFVQLEDDDIAYVGERAARGAGGAVTAAGAPMVFLGYGKFVRADRIYALEPIEGDDRGDGRRTKVWVDGMAEPMVASRTERTILADMGEATALAMAVRRSRQNQMSLDV